MKNCTTLTICAAHQNGPTCQFCRPSLRVGYGPELAWSLVVSDQWSMCTHTVYSFMSFTAIKMIFVHVSGSVSLQIRLWNMSSFVLCCIWCDPSVLTVEAFDPDQPRFVQCSVFQNVKINIRWNVGFQHATNVDKHWKPLRRAVWTNRDDATGQSRSRRKGTVSHHQAALLCII